LFCAAENEVSSSKYNILKTKRKEKQGKRLEVSNSWLLMSSVAGQGKCRFGQNTEAVPFPNRYPLGTGQNREILMSLTV
jgi:hypothetical protein